MRFYDVFRNLLAKFGGFRSNIILVFPLGVDADGDVISYEVPLAKIHTVDDLLEIHDALIQYGSIPADDPQHGIR